MGDALEGTDVSFTLRFSTTGAIISDPQVRVSGREWHLHSCDLVPVVTVLGHNILAGPMGSNPMTTINSINPRIVMHRLKSQANNDFSFLSPRGQYQMALDSWLLIRSSVSRIGSVHMWNTA